MPELDGCTCELRKVDGIVYEPIAGNCPYCTAWRERMERNPRIAPDVIDKRRPKPCPTH